MLDPRLFWSWGLHPGFLLGPPRANLQSSYEILFAVVVVVIILFRFFFLFCFLFKERRERKGVLTVIIILPYIHTQSLKREREREMKIMTWMHTAKIMNAQTLLECGRRLTFFSFVLFFKIFRESATRSRR